MLQAYFRSGWAFLIPYLAAYLLYAWLKWPVNPSYAVEEIVKVMSDSMGNALDAESMGQGARSWVPCLLHVYWALHAMHLVLGAIALRDWLGQAFHLHPASSLLLKAVPWFCLMLLFYVPGTYLEFPADPWEHYARINRWKDITGLGSELGWYYKQTYYFLAYSLLGNLPIGEQLRWMNYYQTALCLLLSYQYYRLARVCGLRSDTAIIFVLLQPLLLGNDLWAFHRYYVLSSSVFSQLGAVTAVRLVVQLSNHYKPAVGEAKAVQSSSRVLLSMSTIAIGFAALNHIQGLALCGLGIFAVVTWHTAKCHRYVFLGWVGLLLLASVATTLWWPRHPALEEIYKHEGWLNYWNGFDIFNTHSNATRRMMLIIGVAGLFNLLAGVVLVRRNHIVGWLTLIPVIALQLPLISIPLANAFANSAPMGIITFHRLFFTIPAGLALAMLGQYLLTHMDHPQVTRATWLPKCLMFPANTFKLSGLKFSHRLPFGLLLTTCLCFTLAPPDYPYCNRLWNSYASMPSDLNMHGAVASFYQSPVSSHTLVVASAAVSNALQSYQPIDSLFSSQERLLHSPERRTPSGDLMRIHHFVESAARDQKFIIIPPQPYLVFTTRSDTAFMTHHWNPAEVALAHTR